MFKVVWIGLSVTVAAGIIAFLALPYFSLKSGGEAVTIPLTRDAFKAVKFPSKKPTTSAIILFASGDGGWGGLEEAIARTLQNHGYEVIGIDSVSYAQTDYDLATLQADFGRIAQAARKSYGEHAPPLIVGGYSMGAAQAIAVAGGPHRPAGLIGLLLVDPCSRGRYGLRTSDQMDVLPTGPGTFSMDDFARTMDHLRVVQWHAENDSIDSRAWLAGLTTPHREFDFPNTGHGYKNDRDDFLRHFVASVEWILVPTETMTAGGKS